MHRQDAMRMAELLRFHVLGTLGDVLYKCGVTKTSYAVQPVPFGARGK